MRFLHPYLLLLLLLVPPMVWLRLRTSRRVKFPFSSVASLRGLPLSWTVLACRLLPWIYGAALALLIVAIARPQRGLAERDATTEGIDIILLLDLSTSMRALDMSTPTRRRDRLEASQDVIEEFVASRKNDRIGLIGFAAVPYSMVPLTMEYDWLIERMRTMKTGMVRDGTAIGTAITSGVNRLLESDAESRVIILLTDGVNNTGRISPEDAARIAAELGIRIYTIGVGSDDGSAEYPGMGFFGGVGRIPVDLDEPMLEYIAEITGGAYFRATDAESLSGVYSKIDALETSEIELKQYTRYEEAFAPFAIAGLLLILLERFLQYSRVGRLP